MSNFEPQKAKKRAAFTLIEVMVAMVVLAIGLLGMAAMTILVMRGNKSAEQMTVATTLTTQKIEALKDTGFDLLGTVTSETDSNYLNYGMSGDVFTGPEGPMNALGETAATPGAEHIYYRLFSICTESATFCDGGACTADVCDLLGDATDGVGNIDRTTSGTPKQVACDSNSANSQEKLLRVVTYWKDRFGKCHRVAMDTIVVNLEN